MHASTSRDLLSLPEGAIVTKRDLFDLIQYSKVKGSQHWEGPDWVIWNTPQQGINWINKPPNCRGVIVKARHGSYATDGWADNKRQLYHYSFKAQRGKIVYTDTANMVLTSQQAHGYPIVLFTETGNSWKHEGRFDVSAVEKTHVVLKRSKKRYTANSDDDLLKAAHTEHAAIGSLLEDEFIPATDRAQLITARIGQGLFRSRVTRIEQLCRVTGITEPAFLVASHIKPWATSNNRERLDGHNGLLLAPHIDHLFDKGFITFENDGRIRISCHLPAAIQDSWKIARSNNARNSKPLTAQQKFYMSFHRRNVFLK